MKLIVLTLFCIAFLSGFSQKDREKILTSFDYIAYYPDSTIRSAQKRQFNLELFTVEFDETGMPVAMGNCQNEQKVGKWIYSDGSSRLFPKLHLNSDPTVVVFDPYDPADHRTEALRPRHEADIIENKEEFQKKYQNLFTP